MSRIIAIGIQDFAKIRESDCFYVDKTDFIREWWDSHDEVTLITRPRRFGKTLNMSMLECFFSNSYAGRKDLFEGLCIWNNRSYRELQGTYPVIFLSFAGIKFTNFEDTRRAINILITDIYSRHHKILLDDMFTNADRNAFDAISDNMDDSAATLSLNRLCEWLHLYYGRKCIILLDEYDTPMQEAWINGFWDEMAAYTRALFNNTFKTNPHLERAMMTGITRVSKESIFSDLNNLTVVTTTSREYATSFGFIQDEVFDAIDEQGVTAAQKKKVKFWYDGFNFGGVKEIYNPWSVTMFLKKGEFDTYWANTSGNGLVSKLIKEGDKDLKIAFEGLLNGGCIETPIDEQIVFDQLTGSSEAIWSLLLASGYLKVVDTVMCGDEKGEYKLAITNHEVHCMFKKMIRSWFNADSSFDGFISYMFKGDVDAMNYYMNEIALNTFSYFDVGGSAPSGKHPEKFYHGFVLGLIVDKAGDYKISSNRESGFGRYDVVMEPKDNSDPAVIIEFKVHDERKGAATLADTAVSALEQIEEMNYDANLLQRGFLPEKIFKYGFAFMGKECLIRKKEGR